MSRPIAVQHKTPNAGQQQPHIEIVRASGARGKFFTLFQIAGEECAAEMIGINVYRAWFIAEPRRTVTVQGGIMTDVIRALHAFQYEPICKKLVVIKPQCKALVPIKDSPKRWMITDKAIDKANHQYTVNRIAYKAHVGTVTGQDVDLLKSLNKPLPIPAIIDQATQASEIATALREAWFKMGGDWPNGKAYFFWAAKERYALVEQGNYLVVAKAEDARKGVIKEDAPHFRAATINRAMRSWTIADLGLHMRIAQFVKLAHPDKPVKVERKMETVPF